MFKPSVQTTRVLRTAFTRAKVFKSIDTCSIEMVGDYRMLEALYSPLVQISRIDGQLYTSAARKYELSPGWIHFDLRDDIVTIDGYHVTAEDAAFSLKRLLLCNTNMHGKVAHFLDVGPIANINDSVDGIVANGLRLSLKIKGVPHLVLSFLSSIDFAIIPKISVDSASLKIIDQRNTTGPYYMGDGGRDYLFSLISQEKHWALREHSAEIIHVLNIETAAEIPELFAKSAIDFVGQSLEVSPETKVELKGSVPRERKPQLHVTDPLFLSGLAYTQRGMEISALQRRRLMSVIQDVFRRNRFPNGSKNEDFFVFGSTLLLEQSFGGLRGAYEKRCEDASEAAAQAPWPTEKLKIAVHPNVVGRYRELFLEVSDRIQFEAFDVSSSFEELHKSNSFDLFQITFDIANHEDTSLIAMLFHLNFFRSTDPDAFMEAYASEPKEAVREKMLQDLHFDAVCNDPTIVPLAKMRSASLTQNGWRIPFPPSIVGTPFFNLEFHSESKDL